MLNDRRAVGNIPAADMDRARRFYQQTLGFAASTETPAGVYYAGGEGTGFFLYPTNGAGQASHTLLSFNSDDLSADVRDLKAKGVAFEDYDIPGIVKTVDSVATMGGARAAWFRDSEGNIIGLIEGM